MSELKTATATPGPTAISIPWGSEPPLELALPNHWPTPDVIAPDRSMPITDYPAALGEALNAPQGMERLEDLVGPDSDVAIVVDDPSRWTPVREAIPVVLQRLQHGGVPDDRISISIGAGRHPGVDDEGMKRRVGEEVARRFRCYVPPVDDLEEYSDLGETTDGIPVRVFKPVAKADLRILIGSVLPHLQAGFGGGYKLIFPGTSHRSTLGAIHRTGLGDQTPTLLGARAEVNPMRCAIRNAASKLGPCYSISHVIGFPGEIFQVSSGHPDVVQDLLAAEVARRYRAPDAGPADVIVAGNAPWPGDPMQSFKVLLNHRAGCRPGGALVGFFRVDPDEIGQSFSIPLMKLIAMLGPLGDLSARWILPATEHFVGASNSAAKFMVSWARELVLDRAVLVYGPPLYDRLGPRLGPVRLFNDQETLWKTAGRLLRLAPGSGNRPILRVFPSGGLTYAPAPETDEPIASI